MRRFVYAYACIICCVLASGAFLMHVSYRVQYLEREVKQYAAQIAKEEEAIKVLKAEWAYLNNPVRLEAMVTQGLALSAPDPQSFFSASDDVSYYNITNDNDIPLPPERPSHTSQSSDLSHDIVYKPISRRGVQ